MVTASTMKELRRPAPASYFHPRFFNFSDSLSPPSLTPPSLQEVIKIYSTLPPFKKGEVRTMLLEL